MNRIQRCSGTSPSFVIVSTTSLRLSPGFPQAEAIRSTSNDCQAVHHRQEDRLRRCNVQECGDQVSVAGFNDGKGPPAEEVS